MNPEMDTAVTTCGNCQTPMPKELRFCRNCGFRLGEGSAEYTPTELFQNRPQGTEAGANSFPHGIGGPVGFPTTGKPTKRGRRMSGMTWMFLALLIFFVGAAVFTAVRSRNAPAIRIGGIGRGIPAPPRSYAGVDEFDTTEGGVTFAHTEPAGGPADEAGLVGGDIITTVDNQPVHSDDEMMEILRRIPIGKTVDIVYLRDGETKKTKLTTISTDEMERLKDAFDERPEGKGRFGYRQNRVERVEIPGTKMFGVRLDDVSPSLPADMAGIKNGDIVIEFDGVPIRTPEELAERIIRAIPYNTIKVVVMRDGQRVEIPVKMGRQ